MSTLRVNAILDAAGGNTATINGVPLRQGVLDPENRIINGAFDFWQRGTSFTANAYGADRWFNNSSTASTMSRQSFALGDTFGSNSPTFFMRQAVSGQSGAGDFSQVLQTIEGVRSYAGQTITVLGWARRASGSGNMAIEAAQNFGTGGSPSATVDGIGPTIVTLTAGWTPFAVTMTIPSVAGKTLGTNNNDRLSINFWTSAGSAFNARTNSLGLQTISVDLWGIHIKLGTHTTAAVDLYKAPELGPELARCQRYCYVPAANPRYSMAWSTGAAKFVGHQTPFPVEMRVSPTVGGVTSYTIEGVTASATGFSFVVDRSTHRLDGTSANSQGDGVMRLVGPNQVPTFDAELGA